MFAMTSTNRLRKRKMKNKYTQSAEIRNKTWQTCNHVQSFMDTLKIFHLKAIKMWIYLTWTVAIFSFTRSLVSLGNLLNYKSFGSIASENKCTGELFKMRAKRRRKKINFKGRHFFFCHNNWTAWNFDNYFKNNDSALLYYCHYQSVTFWLGNFAQ